MFLEGVPGQLESVGNAIAQNDFDNARRRVHAMKPHLKFMGMKTAAGFAETIEQLCADKNDPRKYMKNLPSFVPTASRPL